MVEIFLLILLILIGILYVLYWIPKKLGYPKVGRALSYSVGTLFLVLAILEIFEDQLFSKQDAEQLLSEQNIILRGDFELLENKSMWAIGDYYHTFTLKIANEDKQLLIRSIRNSPNFKIKDSPTWIDDSLFNTPNRYTGKKVIQNYETKLCLIRELFEPQGVGYAPKFRRIEVSQVDNTLRFEDIDE